MTDDRLTSETVGHASADAWLREILANGKHDRATDQVRVTFTTAMWARLALFVGEGGKGHHSGVDANGRYVIRREPRAKLSTNIGIIPLAARAGLIVAKDAETGDYRPAVDGDPQPFYYVDSEGELHPLAFWRPPDGCYINADGRLVIPAGGDE